MIVFFTLLLLIIKPAKSRASSNTPLSSSSPPSPFKPSKQLIVHHNEDHEEHRNSHDGRDFSKSKTRGSEKGNFTSEKKDTVSSTDVDTKDVEKATLGNENDGCSQITDTEPTVEEGSESPSKKISAKRELAADSPKGEKAGKQEDNREEKVEKVKAKADKEDSTEKIAPLADTEKEIDSSENEEKKSREKIEPVENSEDGIESLEEKSEDEIKPSGDSEEEIENSEAKMEDKEPTEKFEYVQDTEEEIIDLESKLEEDKDTSNVSSDPLVQQLQEAEQKETDIEDDEIAPQKSSAEMKRDWISSLQIRRHESTHHSDSEEIREDNDEGENFHQDQEHDQEPDEEVTYFDNPLRMLHMIAPRIRAIRNSPDITLRIRSASVDDASIAAHAIYHLGQQLLVYEKEKKRHIRNMMDGEHMKESKKRKAVNADDLLKDRRFEQLVECVLCGVDVKKRKRELHVLTRETSRNGHESTRSASASHLPGHQEDELKMGEEAGTVQNINEGYPKSEDAEARPQGKDAWVASDAAEETEEEIQLDPWGLSVRDASKAANGISTLLLFSQSSDAFLSKEKKFAGERLTEVLLALCLRCRERLHACYVETFSQMSSNKDDRVIDSILDGEAENKSNGDVDETIEEDKYNVEDLAHDAASALHSFAMVEVCFCSTNATHGRARRRCRIAMDALLERSCWILKQPITLEQNDCETSFDNIVGMEAGKQGKEERNVTKEEFEPLRDDKSVAQDLTTLDEACHNDSIQTLNHEDIQPEKQNETMEDSMTREAEMQSAELSFGVVTTKNSTANYSNEEHAAYVNDLDMTPLDDAIQPALLLDALSPSLSVDVLWSISVYFVNRPKKVLSDLIRQVRDGVRRNIVKQLLEEADSRQCSALPDFRREEGNSKSPEIENRADNVTHVTTENASSCLADQGVVQEASMIPQDDKPVKTEKVLMEKREGEVLSSEDLAVKQTTKSTPMTGAVIVKEALPVLKLENEAVDISPHRRNTSCSLQVETNIASSGKDPEGSSAPETEKQNFSIDGEISIEERKTVFSSRQLLTTMWSLTTFDDAQEQSLLEPVMNVLSEALLYQIDNMPDLIDLEEGDFTALAWTLSFFLYDALDGNHVKQIVKNEELKSTLSKVLHWAALCTYALVDRLHHAKNMDESKQTRRTFLKPSSLNGVDIVGMQTKELCLVMSSIAACLEGNPSVASFIAKTRSKDEAEPNPLIKLADAAMDAVCSHMSFFSDEEMAVILTSFSTIHGAFGTKNPRSRSCAGQLMSSKIGQIVSTIEVSLQKWAERTGLLSEHGFSPWKAGELDQLDTNTRLANCLSVQLLPLFGRTFDSCAIDKAYEEDTVEQPNGTWPTLPFHSNVLLKIVGTMPFYLLPEKTWPSCGGKFVVPAGPDDDIFSVAVLVLDSIWSFPSEKERLYDSLRCNVRDIVTLLWSCAVMSQSMGGKSDRTRSAIKRLVMHMTDLLNRVSLANDRNQAKFSLEHLLNERDFSRLIWALAQLGVKGKCTKMNKDGEENEAILLEHNNLAAPVLWGKPQYPPEKLRGLSPSSSSNMFWGVVNVEDTKNDLVLLEALLVDLEAKGALLSPSHLFQVFVSLNKLKTSLEELTGASSNQSQSAEHSEEPDAKKNDSEENIRNIADVQMEESENVVVMLATRCDDMLQYVSHQLANVLAQFSPEHLQTLLKNCMSSPVKADYLVDALDQEVNTRLVSMSEYLSNDGTMRTIYDDIRELSESAMHTLECQLRNIESALPTNKKKKWGILSDKREAFPPNNDEIEPDASRIEFAASNLNETASAASRIWMRLQNFERALGTGFGVGNKDRGRAVSERVYFELGQCQKLVELYRQKLITKQVVQSSSDEQGLEKGNGKGLLSRLLHFE